MIGSHLRSRVVVARRGVLHRVGLSSSRCSRAENGTRRYELLRSCALHRNCTATPPAPVAAVPSTAVLRHASKLLTAREGEIRRIVGCKLLHSNVLPGLRHSGTGTALVSVQGSRSGDTAAVLHGFAAARPVAASLPVLFRKQSGFPTARCQSKANSPGGAVTHFPPIKQNSNEEVHPPPTAVWCCTSVAPPRGAVAPRCFSQMEK